MGIKDIFSWKEKVTQHWNRNCVEVLAHDGANPPIPLYIPIMNFCHLPIKQKLLPHIPLARPSNPVQGGGGARAYSLAYKYLHYYTHAIDNVPVQIYHGN